MSYSVGTHISFKKSQPMTFFLGSTEFASGTKIRFYNWLQAAAVLDLQTA